MRHNLRWLRLSLALGAVFAGLILIVASKSYSPITRIYAQEDPPTAEYVGSRECGSCHREVDRALESDPHTLTLVNPADNETAIVADFSSGADIRTVQLPGEDEARPFTVEDVAFVVGTGRQLQRYVYALGEDEYRVLPAEWNVVTQIWQPFTLAESWDDPAYDWANCATCHTTAYNPDEHQWEDNGVQCEACHGAGSNHVELADDAGNRPSEDELNAIRAAIISGDATNTQCASCHQRPTTIDEIHYPVKDILEGLALVGEVAPASTNHFTSDNAPLCTTCHMPNAETAEDAGAVHQFNIVLPGAGSPDSCSSCHSDLSAEYLTHFVSETQNGIETRLATVQTALTSANNVPAWVWQAVQAVSNDGSLGIHNYPYTDALLYAAETQLGIVAGNSALNNPALAKIENPNTCQECHREEFADWEGSPHANASRLDAFLQEYAQLGQPAYCMSCHASGYSPATDTYLYEGVVCSSCHEVTSATEHPPAPINTHEQSAACGQCHSGAHAPTYDEWLVSDHSLAGVDCVDCHTPHNNGLILDDINATCGTCHEEALTDEVHMGEDMNCVDCHQTQRTTENGVHVLQTGHTMSIDPSVCAECHGNTHLLSVKESRLSPDEQIRVATLNEEVEALREEADQSRNAGMIGGALATVLVGIMLLIFFRFRRLI